VTFSRPRNVSGGTGPTSDLLMGNASDLNFGKEGTSEKKKKEGKEKESTLGEITNQSAR